MIRKPVQFDKTFRPRKPGIEKKEKHIPKQSLLYRVRKEIILLRHGRLKHLMPLGSGLHTIKDIAAKVGAKFCTVDKVLVKYRKDGGRLEKDPWRVLRTLQRSPVTPDIQRQLCEPGLLKVSNTRHKLVPKCFFQ